MQRREKIYASESIFTDIVVVEDQQEGAALDLVDMKKTSVNPSLARSYHTDTRALLYGQYSIPKILLLLITFSCTLIPLSNYWKESELGYEMGCYYNASINMIEKKLIAKIKEYLPVGVIPVFTFI